MDEIRFLLAFGTAGQKKQFQLHYKVARLWLESILPPFGQGDLASLAKML